MNRLSLVLGMTSAVLLALAPSCLDRRDDEPKASDENRCATCHGEASRPGDFLLRSAPPRDLAGDVDPSYPGVGAHAIHLYASNTHAAIACNECHVVPSDVGSKGHADSDRPAELTFGTLATTGSRTPSYDATTRRCSDSYCHGEAKAVWTEPRSSKDACGTCHGLPPASPHPQSGRCDLCHSQVVDAERNIIAPSLHVDGKIQFAAGDCATCHGSGVDPAPPKDTLGNQDVSSIGVGAHQAHLAGGTSSRPLACAECHTVPSSVDAPGHIDTLPAELIFTGVATTGGRTPFWSHELGSCSDAYCHSPAAASVAPTPQWTEPGPLACTSCHDTPPAPPHPQMSDCSRCHGDVVAANDIDFVDRTLHVDGLVQVTLDPSCTSCHGSQNPAPPVDLSGQSVTTSPGVGAHQAHLLGSASARPVACNECHQVPSTPLASGHIDTLLPAELAFSGAATAFGGTPSYANGTCSNTSCHGGVFPNGHASGGTNTTPLWTKVDGTQAACGTCHALPPPAPHPVGSLNPVCSACHENIAPDNLTFTFPELHVDGVVTFVVP